MTNQNATHIWLVEDEATHAELIRRAFEMHNDQVTLHVAGNLREARASLTTTPPSLIIADLRLPDGDGVELLPTDGARLHYPVIIMTSHGDEQVAVEAMKAGALDYVVKSEATLVGMPRIAERALREWGHITESKRAEEALRASQTNLAEAQRIAHLGSWNWHIAENTLDWSDELYRIFDLDPETTPITFERFLDHVYLDDRAYVMEQMQTAVDERKARPPIEYRVVRPDGTTRTVRSEGVLSLGRDGAPVRLFGTTQDITERKRLEREILEVSNREQRRIGQDLHDELGQLLTGISFRIVELENDLRQKNQPETDDAAEIGEMVKEAIMQTGALARGLNPVSMEAGGLKTALATLTRSIEQIYEIPCTLTCPAPLLIEDNETATHVYRIAQEALNNAIKHGKASRLEVSLVQAEATTTLTVRDNGIGIPNLDVQREGMGLRNMRYRASMIHGSFDVHRGEEGGTVVSCQFTTNRAWQAIA